VDHVSAITVLAPEPQSTAVKAITRSARLEAHLGLVTAAAAAATGLALAEKFHNDTVSAPTKRLGGETIAELLKLYFLTAAIFESPRCFFRVALERGVEVLVTGDIPPEAASFWVDEVMKLLAKVTASQLN